MDNAVALYFMAANNYLLNVMCHLQSKKRLKKRRSWMLTIHKARTTGFINKMFSDITAEPTQFFDFLRMSISDFEMLLQKVAPFITKKDTRFRKAIPAKVRLALTLRYLATGDSFRKLHYLFKTSHQIISKIVCETCTAILNVLKDYVKMPASEQEWLEKEAEFQDILPHCLAAMDGKCVLTSQPQATATESEENKNTHSIILLTLVDRNYNFIYADVGCQVKIDDGGVYRDSLLFKKLCRGELNLPAPSPLFGSDEPMPYVFVADTAFPLKTNIMKPYRGEPPEGSIKRSFNVKLSKAIMIVENVFGLMSDNFRVLRKPIGLQPEHAANVVMSCVLLHNFLRKSSTSNDLYTQPGVMDRIENEEVVPGTWRDEQPVKGALRSLPAVTKSALASLRLRNKFAQALGD